MKQALHLKLGQHLTITPQLQQAIQLLNLSRQELELKIQQELSSNPMLELQDPYEDKNFSFEETQSTDTPNDPLAQELPLDTNWEDIYCDMQTTHMHTSTGFDNSDFNFERKNEAPLKDHLIWQMNLTPFSSRDYLIAEIIIDYINEDGFLTTSLDSIFNIASTQLEDLELIEVTTVQHRIQQFDPPGVGSLNLKEFLTYQLRNFPADIPYLSLIKEIIENHLDLLAKKNVTKLCHILKQSESEIRHAIEAILTLRSKPATLFDNPVAEHIEPDLIVTKNAQERWAVELNKENLPKLKINPFYASLIKRADTTRENKFLQEQIQEAKWFLKSLSNRNDTLLRVGTSIMKYQQAFLEQGPTQMKPLVLSQIAEETGLHESTISRITTQKYIHTPQGLFELKYFFSSQIKGNEDSGTSSTAIKAFIKKIIINEKKTQPLSDSQIAKLLSEQGMNVARRTIAKYRENLSIPPSAQRKDF